MVRAVPQKLIITLVLLTRGSASSSAFRPWRGSLLTGPVVLPLCRLPGNVQSTCVSDSLAPPQCREGNVSGVASLQHCPYLGSAIPGHHLPGWGMWSLPHGERGPPSTQTEAKASLTQLLNAQRHALPFTLLLTCAYQEWLRSQLPCHSPQHHKRGTGWLRVSGVTPFWGTPSRLQLHPKGQGRKPRISSELERP